MDGVLEETRALSAIGHWDEVIRILDSHFDSSKRSMASAVALADPDADYLPAMYFS